MTKTTSKKNKLLDKFLNLVETVGHALPHPATLFALFALAIVVISGIVSAFHLEVTHPATGEIIKPVSLLNVEGLHRILVTMVTNFTSFAPLGTVLVAMLGIGVAESSGLIGSGLRLLVLKAPQRLLTFVIVFAGILSNTARAGAIGFSKTLSNEVGKFNITVNNVCPGRILTDRIKNLASDSVYTDYKILYKVLLKE